MFYRTLILKQYALGKNINEVGRPYTVFSSEKFPENTGVLKALRSPAGEKED